MTQILRKLKCFFGFHKWTPPASERDGAVQRQHCVYCPKQKLVLYAIMESDIPDDLKCKHGIKFKGCTTCMAKGVL